MRSIPWIGALVLALSVVVGCGGSEEGSDDAAAARASMLEWLEAAAQGDPDVACDLMTEVGRNEIADAAEVDSCEDLFSDSSRESNARVPDRLVGPVGAEDGIALAVIRYGGTSNDDPEENLVYTMREDDGEWKVDSIRPIPDSDELAEEGHPSEEAKIVAEDYTQALSERSTERACGLLSAQSRAGLTGPPAAFKPGTLWGPKRIPIEEFTACRWHVEIARSDWRRIAPERVLAVGNIGLWYPADENLAPKLMVKDPEGWRVDTTSLGAL